MSASPPAAIEPIKPVRRFNTLDVFGRFAPVIFLAVLFTLFSALEPGFRTWDNVLIITRQMSFIGIIAVGMTFVILTAGIDLSVGSTLAFAGIVCASAAKGSRSLTSGKDNGGLDVLWAILAAVGVGLALGLMQGFFIGKLKIPAFIVTLGDSARFAARRLSGLAGSR